MKHITIYTKPTMVNGQYRIATLGLSLITEDQNVFHHVVLILRLKGAPEAAKHNFAYTFGFNFGGQR